MNVTDKPLSRVDFFILIGITVFFMPFFGSSSTLDPVLTTRFLVWGIMLFVLSTRFAIRLHRNPDDINCSVLRRMIFPVFLGYFLFSLISLIKAVNVTEGIYEILKIFLSIASLFVATIILGKQKNYIPILVKAVIAAAMLLSVLGIEEYLRCDSALYSVTMANPNQLSSALFLMLPFCLYAALVFHDYWRVVGTIAIALILCNIFLIQARAVWVALFVSSVTSLIVVYLLVRTSSMSKEVRALLIRRVACIGVALIVAISISRFFYSGSSSADRSIGRVKSVTDRFLIWRKSLGAVEDNLFLGVGAGNWRITLPSCGLDKLPDGTFKNIHFQRPHNDYIWVLSETGIFGLILYLSIFGVIIVYIFRIIIQGSHVNDRLLSISVFFGIVGYMTISFFSFPKERICHSVLLILMMAIVVSIYHKAFGDKKDVSRTLKLVLTVPSLLLLLFAMVSGYARFNAEVHTRRALGARAVGHWPMVVSEIDKGYSVFATLDPMSTPLQWYRGEANFLLNNVPQALEDFKKAYKAHPYHIHVLNNLATCHESQGNHKEAIYYYKKALDIYPEFEECLINLGATYYNSGSYEQAYETLLRCDPNTENPKWQKYLETVKKELDKEKKL